MMDYLHRRTPSTGMAAGGTQRPTVHSEPPPSIGRTSFGSSGNNSMSTGPVSPPLRPPASFSRSGSMRGADGMPRSKRPASGQSSRQSSSDSIGSQTTASSISPTPPPAAVEEDLIQVVYTSSAYSRHISLDEIRSILAISRANNSERNITGLLLYRDGSFAQFLEGPPDAVDSLYDQIERDPRHRGIIRVVRQSVSKRDFSQWSMAFRDLDMLKNNTGDALLQNADQGFSQLMNVGLKVGDHTDSEYRPDAFGNAKLDLPADMSASMRKLVTTFYRLLDRPL